MYSSGWTDDDDNKNATDKGNKNHKGDNKDDNKDNHKDNHKGNTKTNTGTILKKYI